ncbi:MAG: family 43 glycosylhydrolase [Terricaulis sp.]
MQVSRRSVLAAGALGIVTAPAPATAAPRASFTPGRVWTDTAGRPLYVHGGSILKVGELFYWYGENKEHTVGNDGVWHWGVRCYTSRDLYNWDDAGIIIPPAINDERSPLNPRRFTERPHIIFNPRTRKFVCWLKTMETDTQTRTVLQADAITGPYRLIATGIRPLGMGAGDFDLVVSPDDAKAYMYFERVHSELICADLSDDYTAFTGYYSTHFPRVSPPFVREGPAYFVRNHKHYLATSGTTGYYPNPSEIAVADTYHGPWTTLGQLYRGDRSETSFNSQISSVFKHPAKKDLYIAIADRWLPSLSGPSFESGQDSRDVRSAFRKAFMHPPETLTPREQALMAPILNISGTNTSVATQIWLPIQFHDGRPYIAWRDEWSLDEFE